MKLASLIKHRPLHLVVKMMMLDKGVTQTDLVKKFNVAKSYVSMALRGERFSLLLKIASYVYEHETDRTN